MGCKLNNILPSYVFPLGCHLYMKVERELANNAGGIEKEKVNE